jgi:glycine/D-amino acid oxidase-like deaminating enzyme
MEPFMPETSAEIVICGAGIAGIAAAYHLTVKQGIKDVLLVDERPPMSLTSDKSTECYRNWWPGPGDAMVRFMNHSIDLLEELARESSNTFQMNRRGYVFLTGDPQQASQFEKTAREISALGAGPLRIHRGRSDDPPFVRSPAEGFQDLPTGADLVLDPLLIQKQFPFITGEAVAMLHPRRCGWLSAQQLGAYLLRQAQAQGAALIHGRVVDVKMTGGRVTAVKVEGAEGGTRVETDRFVMAPGPYLKEVGHLVGIDLPVYNELHGKVAIKDSLNIVSRDAPLMLWNDPVSLIWSDVERAELAGDEDTRWLTETFPAGVHFRPEGAGKSPILLMLWTYDLHPQDPVWPPIFEPEYPEIVLRGLARMVPGLKVYLERMPTPYVDGGYYCKTRENRPLIGPLPVEGAFVYGALSGYGIMAAMAGGELLAAHVTGMGLPDYAPAFTLDRYEDPNYRQLLENWDATSGQL